MIHILGPFKREVSVRNSLVFTFYRIFAELTTLGQVVSFWFLLALPFNLAPIWFRRRLASPFFVQANSSTNTSCLYWTPETVILAAVFRLRRNTQPFGLCVTITPAKSEERRFGRNAKHCRRLRSSRINNIWRKHSSEERRAVFAQRCEASPTT